MAKLRIEYLLPARLEADEACDWYRVRSLRTAERFQLDLDAAQAAIQRMPDAWPKYLRDTRYYRLKQFPYIVVYRVLESCIEIVAVVHGRRKPGYWVDRLVSKP
jgi:plasmid stabilization system protein ParE